jgi:hypothetical protein
MIRKIILLFSIAGLIYACAPKTMTVKTEDTYTEDLSGTLPEVDSYKSPAMEIADKKNIVFSKPDMDITAQLDTLLDSIAVINEKTPYYRYTVLVHNSNSRQAAEEAKRNVFRIFPNAQPQMQFVSPSYRVKVGHYFNRIDAYQTMVRLKELFPNAVIVPEQVYIK